MKVTTIIDPDREEEIILHLHSTSDLTEKIEQLVMERNSAELVGFSGETILPIDYVKVSRFTVENDKIYACIGSERYWIKQRLYQIEQQAPDYFVKIHQSCLANTRQIARFEVAFSGTLRVVFKNGDVDYVSRRQLKQVKERFGL